MVTILSREKLYRLIQGSYPKQDRRGVPKIVMLVTVFMMADDGYGG